MLNHLPGVLLWARPEGDTVTARLEHLPNGFYVATQYPITAAGPFTEAALEKHLDAVHATGRNAWLVELRNGGYKLAAAPAPPSEWTFDRLGPTGFDPTREPIVSIPTLPNGDADVAHPLWTVMLAVGHADRAHRVQAAWLVLYSPSPLVRLHHRAAALGIIDGTGDPLAAKTGVPA